MSNKKGKRKSLESWQEIINRCKASGLSNVEWCKENNISQSTFYNNLRKLKNINVADESKVSLIQEVIPVDSFLVENEGKAAITLYINEIKIEINNHAEEDVLNKTLAAVKKYVR